MNIFLTFLHNCAFGFTLDTSRESKDQMPERQTLPYRRADDSSTSDTTRDVFKKGETVFQSACWDNELINWLLKDRDRGSSGWAD